MHMKKMPDMKGMPKKDGGRMCKAVGGVAKIRHKQATPAGAPKAPPRRS